jgi:hypothetical protein
MKQQLHGAIERVVLWHCLVTDGGNIVTLAAQLECGLMVLGIEKFMGMVAK